LDARRNNVEAFFFFSAVDVPTRAPRCSRRWEQRRDWQLAQSVTQISRRPTGSTRVLHGIVGALGRFSTEPAGFFPWTRLCGKNRGGRDNGWKLATRFPLLHAADHLRRQFLWPASLREQTKPKLDSRRECGKRFLIFHVAFANPRDTTTSRFDTEKKTKNRPTRLSRRGSWCERAIQLFGPRPPPRLLPAQPPQPGDTRLTGDFAVFTKMVGHLGNSSTTGTEGHLLFACTRTFLRQNSGDGLTAHKKVFWRRGKTDGYLPAPRAGQANACNSCRGRSSGGRRRASKKQYLFITDPCADKHFLSLGQQAETGFLGAG